MKIRTIKPQFYRHRALFDLEKETQLPMRVAWSGLFGICDREGRFEWNPESIKLDVLPFDDLDFAWILDALVARGFIIKYRRKVQSDQSTGVHMHARASKCYGLIPTFLEHQRPNSHEAKSILPTLDDSCEVLTVEFPSIPKRTCMHVQKSEEVEGKGREGKRKKTIAQLANSKFDLNAVYQRYPRKIGKTEGMKKLAKELQSQDDLDAVVRAIERFTRYHRDKGTEEQFIPYFSTFMTSWKDWLDPNTGKAAPPPTPYKTPEESLPAFQPIEGEKTPLPRELFGSLAKRESA